MKPGRNDPCPCGSGRKFKKCHLLSVPRANSIPPEVLEQVLGRFEEAERERQALADMGVFMNFVKPVLHGEGKIWAIGSGIFLSLDPNQTFHDFILEVLIDTLGRDWWTEQHSVPIERQHFIVQCAAALAEWKERNSGIAVDVSPGVKALEPDGLGLYLLSLAFDVASLRHTLSLPESLVNRLRHRDQFQGARYELAVSAIFTRLDCEVSFLEDASSKHPEFVATFRPTGAKLSVEVKSRHRPGVLHMKGEKDEEAAARGDVRGLFKQALEQDPGDMPFLVFIDLNSPVVGGRRLQDSTWFRDVRNLLDNYGTPTPERPDPFAALILTNYAHHYQEGVAATRGEHLTVWPLFTRDELDPQLRTRLEVALAHYGKVPDLDMDITTTTG